MFLGRNKREKIAFSIIYKSLFISAMTKENENVPVANKSSYTIEEIMLPTKRARMKEELKECSPTKRD